MNIAVRYYSRGGNTQKLAEAAAEAVGVTACDLSVPLDEKVDLLLLGNSLYAGSFDGAVRRFLTDNAQKIGTLASFGSSASGRSTYAKLKALAAELSIPVSTEYYNYPGSFLFMHRGRPDQGDLTAVAAFAKRTAERCAK